MSGIELNALYLVDRRGRKMKWLRSRRRHLWLALPTSRVLRGGSACRESTALTMRRKPMQSRPYKPVRACWLVAVLLLLSCGLAQAQEFEGAWKLTMRKLPNGTTLMPPAVQGAIMGQAGLWTRVVFWHT